jgi:hypothetical protein
MPFKPALLEAAREVLAFAKEKSLSIITAESCTSGLLASVLSEAPGAANLLHGGFVTYTKRNKTVALGVPEETLITKGAVNEEVARAMAEGALKRSPADMSAVQRCAQSMLLSSQPPSRDRRWLRCPQVPNAFATRIASARCVMNNAPSEPRMQM